MPHIKLPNILRGNLIMKQTGTSKPSRAVHYGFEKIPSGIQGPDAITGGGFSNERPAPGRCSPACGRSLFAVEFIARGITGNEPGVFPVSGEKINDLKKNSSQRTVNRARNRWQ
jgi:hypothetical protein